MAIDVSQFMAGDLCGHKQRIRTQQPKYPRQRLVETQSADRECYVRMKGQTAYPANRQQIIRTRVVMAALFDPDADGRLPRSNWRQFDRGSAAVAFAIAISGMLLVKVPSNQRAANTASHSPKRSATQCVAEQSTAGTARDGSNCAISTATMAAIILVSSLVGTAIIILIAGLIIPMMLVMLMMV